MSLVYTVVHATDCTRPGEYLQKLDACIAARRADCMRIYDERCRPFPERPIVPIEPIIRKPFRLQEDVSRVNICAKISP